LTVEVQIEPETLNPKSKEEFTAVTAIPYNAKKGDKKRKKGDVGSKTT